MDIVLATRNRKKVEEMNRLFEGQDIRFISLAEFPECPEVEEDGATFRANALKKARTVSLHTGLPALADDSGLVVDALGGLPGVYSARYAGPSATDQDNVRKLLHDLKGIPLRQRSARFVCCIAYAKPDGSARTCSGKVEGRIGVRERGSNGFGYDPVFIPEGHEQSFAEMSGQEKDAMSHRGRAIRKMARFLKRLLK